MYAREFEGWVLTFGVSGNLIMNALVMYDRQTDSLWSQFTGSAVTGEFTGESLEPLASTFTDWSTWRDTHPDTVLLEQGRFNRGDPYGGYYGTGAAGVTGRENVDSRLTGKEQVVGVQFGGEAKAYPFRHLDGVPVLNDHFADRDLLVVFDIANIVATVFDRSTGGRTLTFDLAEAPDRPELIVALRDRETGSLWSGVTGEAVEGSLTGERLTVVPTTPVFWFAWADFFPDSELWEP